MNKTKESSTTFDWVNAIIRESFTVDKTEIELYRLPINTPLYRGDIDDFDTFDSSNDFDRPISWFSNYSIAALYGPIVEYQLKKIGYFIAMDTPRNIRWLRSQFSDREKRALDLAFRIETKTCGNAQEEYVIRISDDVEDVIIANALCNLIQKVKGTNFDGWVHLRMKSYGNKFMGPEIMICNPAKLVKPVKTFPFEGFPGKLDSIRIYREKKGKKDIQHKRSYITYMKSKEPNPQS